MKKVYFLSSLILLTATYTHALSPLPKNSYLRFGDTGQDVLFLQQILNSDPDTVIAQSGVGSPGNENTNFGKLTQVALKKFQGKNELEETGEGDYKTWEKINNYVGEKNNPTKNIPEKPQNPQEKNNNSQPPKKNPSEDNNSEENIFLGNSDNKPTNQPETAATQTPTKSYLDSVLDKYFGYFRNTDSQTPNSANQPATENVPTQVPQQQNIPQQQNLSAQSGNPTQQPQQQSFMQRLQNSLLGGVMKGIQPGAETGNINNAGQVSGQAGDIGQCEATSFAHATLEEGCAADRADQQNNQQPASFGVYKVYLSREGVPAIPAVALPKRGSFGDAVEVKDLSTGKCKAFPLLDRGPAPFVLAKGKCIDLTGSAVDILRGKEPCKTVTSKGGKQGAIGIRKVQYAIVQGEKIKPGEVKDCKNLN